MRIAAATVPEPESAQNCHPVSPPQNQDLELLGRQQSGHPFRAKKKHINRET